MASDTAALLLSLRMWQTAAQLMRAAAAAICIGSSAGTANAAAPTWPSSLDADAAAQPSAVADAAAAEGLGAQLQQMALEAEPLAPSNAVDTDADSAAQLMPARAVLPLLCQLASAATTLTSSSASMTAADGTAAASSGQKSEGGSQVAQRDLDGGAARGLTALAAHTCLAAIQQLLAAPPPGSRR